MDAIRFFRSLLAALVGVMGIALVFPSMVAAQGPELEPAIGSQQQNKGEDADAKSGVKPANPEQAEQDSERSPAAETYSKGAKAFEKGEVDAAVALLSRAIELDAKYAPAYCDRGLALVMKGDVDKALTDLDTAIRLAPGAARSYFNRGFAYFQKGKFDKALSDYSEAIRLRPAYAEAYRDRGFVRVLSGDPAGAMPDLNLAVRLRQKRDRLHQPRQGVRGDGPMGPRHLRLQPRRRTQSKGPRRLVRPRKRPGDERRFQVGTVRHRPGAETRAEGARALFIRGFVYRKQGQLDKAMADFDQAVRVEPHFGEAYREAQRGLDGQARARQGPDRSEPGDQAGARGPQGAVPPRPGLRRPRRSRQGPGRLRRGDQARSGIRRGAVQPCVALPVERRCR